MKSLKQNLSIFLLTFIALRLYSQGGTGAIKGQILNSNNEPVFGAVIRISQGGILIGGTTTDEKGMYTYKPLNPGLYELLVTSVETQAKRMSNIEVGSEKTSYVDMKVTPNELPEVIVEVVYEKPLIDKTYMSIKEITSEDFTHMAIDRGNIIQAVTAVSSEVTSGEEGELYVRGSRGQATAYVVDGVQSPGIKGVSALSVQNVAIITGGIPAQYGDNTGGVIIVTTKDYFTGIRSKHIREQYMIEREERIKREKNIIAEEKSRKKEIEEELRLEKESMEKNR